MLNIFYYMIEVIGATLAKKRSWDGCHQFVGLIIDFERCGPSRIYMNGGYNCSGSGSVGVVLEQPRHCTPTQLSLKWMTAAN